LKALRTDAEKVILTEILAEIKLLWVIINEDFALREFFLFLKDNNISK
jgi:hypothetical protein